MANLSAKDLKNLGISEGEINQYEDEGLLQLALAVVGNPEIFIKRAEFLKANEEDKKLYHQKIAEAVDLIRQLKKDNNFDVDIVRKELENKLRTIEKQGPKIKEVK